MNTNLVLGKGSLPFLLAGHPARYARTIRRLQALSLESLIPGHGLPGAPPLLARYIDYLDTLVADVKRAREAGWTLEEALRETPLAARFAIAPDLPSAPFYRGLHPFNVQRAFLETEE